MYCDADSSNFEGEESTTHRATNKKKIPKNKPFDGHGIGYHQGKAVIIKLLPAPETYNIINKPAFPMFHYFSKTPQVLSAPEIARYGPGKRVMDSYKPYKEDYESQSNKEIQNLNSFYTAGGKNHDKPDQIINDVKPTSKTNESNSRTQQSNTSPSQNGKAATSSETEDEELSDAFKRLQKILKTHVYPSHVLDLKAYKINTDYREFEDPSVLPKIAYDFIDHTPSKENANSKESSEYIKSLYNEGPASLYPENQRAKQDRLRNPKEMYELFIPANEYDISNDAESTYRTSYPFKTHQHLSNGTLEIKTPEYALYENIKDKHNYSGLYDPSSHENEAKNTRKYTLFGNPVPIYDDWYQKDHLKRNPVDYGRESFTYVSPSSSHNEKIRVDDASEGSEQEPEKGSKYTGSFSPQLKQPYTLFGAPVPLTNSWYKVDNEQEVRHYPYKRLHSTEASGSDESHEYR